MTTKRNLTEHKLTQNMLSDRERTKWLLESLNLSQQIAKIGSWDWNLLSNHVWWSDETYRIFGVSPENFIPSFEANSELVHPDDLQMYGELFEHSLKTSEPLDFDIRLVTKGGVLKYCHVKGKVVLDDSGQAMHCIGTILDITERKQSEEKTKALQAKLIQSQKMEAIGTLAGGIAHDFNNILGAILGYTEIAKDSIPEESLAVKYLDKVLDASHRAATLVKQILAFSRQTDIKRVLLKPARIVKEAINLIRPSLPSTIAIKQVVDTTTKPIFADPTQVHQILVNLCTNAFHAMEQTGGILEITLKDCEISQGDLPRHPEVQPGSFVVLSVSDTGTGIASDIGGKIFDPYFTTKEVGKGTGMGLSIVHGIVTSYGGFITSENNPGKGSVFQVYFPAFDKEIFSDIKPMEVAQSGTEHILLVDDETMLAELGKTMFELLGYKVTMLTSSLEALTIFKNQPERFDVVITDQTMPGITGIDLAKRMLEIRPDIPIILCTGHSTLVSEEQAKAEGLAGFAMKPLSKKVISTLLRQVLDK